MINFASDNAAAVHPKVIEMITKVNSDYVSSYGNDKYTEKATSMFKELFKSDVETFFVFNGTGANVVSLASMLKPYEMVITALDAHITEDECGAPDRFTGNTIRIVQTKPGKLTKEEIQTVMYRKGDVHKAQPKVVSISQATEHGLVYSIKEMKALGDYCKENGLYLHVDGARVANAVAGLKCHIKEITSDAGVDILSFGGTKNGLMGAEAIVVFNDDLKKELPFFRKQGMQLASKMRYLSAQFIATLDNNLWLELAENANKMTALMYEKIADLKGIKILYKPDANMIFANLPENIVSELLKEFYFYPIKHHPDGTVDVRIMTNWQTKVADIDSFVAKLKSIKK